MKLTFVIPTHNPDPVRFRRTLAGLADQSLPAAEWDTLIFDNASVPPLAVDALPATRAANTRLLVERRLGLSAAHCSPQADHFGSLRERLVFPRSTIASVVHVDYSVRLQTIRRENHPDMHRLLTAFKRRPASRS